MKTYQNINIKHFILLSLFAISSFSQKNFTSKDSVMGSITPQRVWWDVKHYDLNIRVFPEEKKIKGFNKITYKVLKSKKILQFELQPPLIVDSILQEGTQMLFHDIDNSYFVYLKKEQKPGLLENIVIYYHGKPKTAKHAPWDGGFVWSKDKEHHHFIATANQAIGASVWWPCKDHPADEPERLNVTLTVPSDLKGVSNGLLVKQTKNNNNTTSYRWQVKNPINPYGVSLNIADYFNYKEKFKGLNGGLICDYYILPENSSYAKYHFKDVKKSLEAFEYWFGPYPFYKDSYKLVEVPYLGMEHQSCIAYGNKYKKGYLGSGLGDSKWGMKFDYIIVHETGHEWFANSITCNDVADLWIHEAFTTYSEGLFLEYHYHKKACSEYVTGFKKYVKNDKPIIGHHQVKKSGSQDMYFKGALMLHTLRCAINNDVIWRDILLGLNTQFYHQTVSGFQIINYIDQKVPYLNLKPFFYQYLNTVKIPTLEIKQEWDYVHYRWKNTVPSFSIPIQIVMNHQKKWISPKQNKWTKIKGTVKDFKIDSNYYIDLIVKKQ